MAHLTAIMSHPRLLLSIVLLFAVSGAPARGADDAPLPKGVRVLSTGNSFSGGVPDLLQEMARLAGIKGHVWAERQGIGGSRVIQHWDLPDDQNKAKQALLTGNIDVMTMNPIFMPDEGIAKFVKLGLEKNPDIRFTIQQSWLIRDQRGEPETEPLYAKRKYRKLDPNARTGDGIRQEHAPVFAALENHVRELNRKAGHAVVFIVPYGQASILLREKIIAHQAPDLKSQTDLFPDEMCHPGPVMQTLGAYCHFAVIYRRSPVGLPVPSSLAKMKLPGAEKLNLLLQELAWQAVTEHPLSGLTSKKMPRPSRPQDSPNK